MTPAEALYLAILIFTGIVSGLGIGEALMSRAQYWLLQETRLQPDLKIRMALRTNLFVVIVQRKTLFVIS
jgi:hypothetical protein